MLEAKIDKATAAAHQIVAGISGRKIRVYGWLMVAANTVTAKWVSASTDKTGAMTMSAGAPNLAPVNGNAIDPVAWFTCGSGEDLNLTLGGAVQVSGCVLYDYIVE